VFLSALAERVRPPLDKLEVPPEARSAWELDVERNLDADRIRYGEEKEAVAQFLRRVRTEVKKFALAEGKSAAEIADVLNAPRHSLQDFADLYGHPRCDDVPRNSKEYVEPTHTAWQQLIERVPHAPNAVSVRAVDDLITPGIRGASSDVLWTYRTDAALTITVASLASSTSRVGRQSTVVDNSTNRDTKATIEFLIKLGTSPTSARSVYFTLLRVDQDGTTVHRDDQAGASDAALTCVTMPITFAAPNKTSGAATGDNIQGSFVVDDLPLSYIIHVSHDTGVNLDSTAGNHWVRQIGMRLQAQ
jgi:hypothetical protein